MANLVHEPRVQAQAPAQAPARRTGGEMQPRRRGRVNVGGTERDVSLAAGAALTVHGLTRASLAGLAEAAVGGFLIYRGATGRCPVYQNLGVDTGHTDGRARAEEITEKGVHVEQSMLIQRPAEELYAFWHDFQNLPRIMTHLVTVQRGANGRTHWVATAPKLVGGQVAWDAEVTADEPNRRIAWRSVPGSQIETIGEVRFEPAPGDRGTYVHAVMSYVPPGGKLGHLLAWLLDATPTRKMRDDLRNFKRLMETGEILTTVGQPRGTCTGTGIRQQSR